MKASEVELRMDVVTSDSPRAEILQVDDFDNTSARLTYNTSAGMRVNAGWFDIPILSKPTDEQINNSQQLT